jgi:hypothetical protein
MNTVDINVLLGAFFEGSATHRESKDTLEVLRKGSQALIIFPVVASGFIRISTSRRMSSEPVSTQLALSFLQSLLSSQRDSVMDPGSDYWREFSSLVSYHSARDADVTVCQIAASAIVMGATLYSFDRGFARFKALTWVDPATS